jgi:TfoX/Sxy family transcriptional regulator of competence genes
MPPSGVTPALAYARVVETLAREPAVEAGRAFHNPGLKVGGKLFAMLVRDELVVKLPAPRCLELVTEGMARPFDRGQGRPLREWVCLKQVDEKADERWWLALAREALAFGRVLAA